MISPEDLSAVIAPLGCGSVGRYWALLATRDQLVAWPYSLPETLRAAFSLKTGVIRDPSDILLTDNPSVFQEALSGRELRIHLAPNLAGVVVQFRAIGNRIIVREMSGAIHVYSILARNTTSGIRESL